MATYIKDLTISSFRGLRDFKIDQLGDVNILVGDNNTGKTSVLEAIQLLCVPTEYQLVKVSSQREEHKRSLKSRLDVVEAVKYLFDFQSQPEAWKEIYIETSERWIPKDAPLFSLYPEKAYIAVHAQEAKQMLGNTMGEEISVLFGHIENGDKTPEGYTKYAFEYHNLSKIKSSSTPRMTDLKVVFVSAMAHLTEDAFKTMMKTPESREKAVELLALFDPGIKAVTYQESDDRKSVLVFHVSGIKEYIPLSVYGDGIKKALTLLNAIMEAEDGIVLIDEFETALHTTVMRPVFKFMLAATKRLNVQLFLTTHSLEALDTLLRSDEENVARLNVIQIRKNEKGIFTKTTDGKEALRLRKKFEMEFRV